MKLTVTDVDVRGKAVFVRVDFNVPLTADGNVSDDTRIRAALPTIQYLQAQGAKVILASHLGRPKGKVDLKYSLRPVIGRLAELLGTSVAFAEDCIGAPAREAVARMQPGQVVLLENLRFHAGEEKNEADFARELAALAEVYVNDAFGTAHRAHASTEGVTHLLQPAAAGFLLQKEIEFLGKALKSPERPFVAILGGAKVSDKIAVVENLLDKVDALLIGGGMANTFLAAQGYALGKSLVEQDKVDLAKQLLLQAEQAGIKIHLPVDAVIAGSLDDAAGRVVEVKAVPEDQMMLDIGPETARRFAEVVKTSGMVVWNGPMGVFEKPAFAAGTVSVARALAQAEAISIIGGGDSAAAIEQAGLAAQITHISTGGGASLEFLEGKQLPGVAALTDR